jgi:hypothetical protein
MVPTEEKRLPIRVPISVRGLNASESPFPIPLFVLFPHSHRMYAVLRAGPEFEHSLQTILLIENSLIIFDSFLYFLRSIPAM